MLFDPIMAVAWGILASAMISTTVAQISITCDATDGFYKFNSSKTVKIPAMRTITLGKNNHRVEEDPGNTWYFSARTSSRDFSDDGDAMTYMWLNTGTRNVSDVGVCMDAAWTYGLNGFSFSRNVLERSLDDTGDCKIMLGEQCATALERAYTYAGLGLGSTSTGRCEPLGDLPDECRSVVDGGSYWRGGTFTSGINLGSSLDKQTLAEAGCPNSTMATNSSIHQGPGLGGHYDTEVRFPRPYFLTFWPNRTGQSTESPRDVQVKLLCLRPDDIAEGSRVPPLAQDILNAKDVKYAGNATSKTTSPSPSDTEGAAVKRTMAPYLGAAAIAGLLLV